MKPHVFLARAGFAVIWERTPGDVWALWSDDAPTAGPMNNHATTTRWVFGNAEVARFLLEEWKASEDFIPESDFKVCQVTGAFTAWEQGAE